MKLLKVLTVVFVCFCSNSVQGMQQCLKNTIEYHIKRFLPYNPLILILDKDEESLEAFSFYYPKGKIFCSKEVLQPCYTPIDLLYINNPNLQWEDLRELSSIARVSQVIAIKLYSFSRKTINRSSLKLYFLSLNYYLSGNYQTHLTKDVLVFIQKEIYESIYQ